MLPSVPAGGAGGFLGVSNGIRGFLGAPGRPQLDQGLAVILVQVPLHVDPVIDIAAGDGLDHVRVRPGVAVAADQMHDELERIAVAALEDDEPLPFGRNEAHERAFAAGGLQAGGARSVSCVNMRPPRAALQAHLHRALYERFADGVHRSRVRPGVSPLGRVGHLIAVFVAQGDRRVAVASCRDHAGGRAVAESRRRVDRADAHEHRCGQYLYTQVFSEHLTFSLSFGNRTPHPVPLPDIVQTPTMILKVPIFPGLSGPPWTAPRRRTGTGASAPSAISVTLYTRSLLQKITGIALRRSFFPGDPSAVFSRDIPPFARLNLCR